MGDFVLGYDGSDCAKVALARAIEIAKELDEGLIVTSEAGTYGQSPIKGAILGSTPHKLLHLSTRPVLVVPDSR